MAHDEELADRVRSLVRDEPGMAERRMFGGLAFLVNGNMAVSVSSRGGLLLRVDPAETDELVRDPAASRFEMRGRGMDGWLHVHPVDVAGARQLQEWVALGLAYSRSLPPKRS